MRCKIQPISKRLILMSAILAGWLHVDACAQTDDGDLKFPYQAIVSSGEALIYSGPGKVHYATNKLKQNATVEVYRHDPGGWCAIRPTNDSFSLIPESAIEIVEDGVGRIREDGTQAWVGTQLGPVDKPLWQIKLKKDETVEILGEANWPNPEGHSTIWYQIAPPAGEFRWIHVSDFQQPPTLEQLVAASVPEVRLSDRNRVQPAHRDYPPELAQQQPAVTYPGSFDPGVQPAAYQRELDAQTRESQPARQSPPIRAINHGWKKAHVDRFDVPQSDAYENSRSQLFSANDLGSNNSVRDFSRANEAFENNRAPDPRLASSNMNSTFDVPDRNRNDGEPDRFNPPDSSFSSAGFNNPAPLTNRLADLELELNHELIKQPTQWNLGELNARVDSIYEATDDPLERLQAERMLGKLENLRKIKSGYQGAQVPSTNSKGAIGTGVSGDDEFSLGTMYDAYGWLNELVRDGGTMQSTFVLQDENGKITHHVSPSPGFNLRPYLKTKVGIIGPRGYHTGLNLNHVTAERVIELKRR